MPQMFPSNWLTMSLLIILIYSMDTYYMNMKQSNKKISFKTKNLKWNW